MAVHCFWLFGVVDKELELTVLHLPVLVQYGATAHLPDPKLSTLATLCTLGMLAAKCGRNLERSSHMPTFT